MQPRKLRILNVGPYVDETVNFSEIPGSLIAVSGLNGSGKTFLLESVFFGAYRELPTRSDGVYPYCTERNAAVELEFEMGGRIYTSFINIDSKNRKMESVLALDKSPLNDGKTGTFDTEVEKILGPQYQILASSFGAQDKRGNFVSMSKGKRKDLFIQMIGLEMLQKISDAAGSRGKALEPEKTGLYTKLEMLKETIAMNMPDVEALRIVAEESGQIEMAIRKSIEELSGDLVLKGAQFDRFPELNAKLGDVFLKHKEAKETEEKLSLSLQSFRQRAERIPEYSTALEAQKVFSRDMNERIIVLREKCTNLASLKDRSISANLKFIEHSKTCQALQEEIATQNLLAAGLPFLKEKEEILATVQKDIFETSKALRELSSDLVKLSEDDAARTATITEFTRKVDASVNAENKALLEWGLAKQNAAKLKEVPCGGVGEYASCQFIKDAAESMERLDELAAAYDNAKASCLAKNQDLAALPRPDAARKQMITSKANELTGTLRELAKKESDLTPAVKSIPAAESATYKLTLLNESLNTAKQESEIQRQAATELQVEISAIDSYKSQLDSLVKGMPDIEENIKGLEIELKVAETSKDAIPPTEEQLATKAQEIASLSAESTKISSELISLTSDKEKYDKDLAFWKDLKEVKFPAAMKKTDDAKKALSQAENDARVIAEAQTKADQAQAELDNLTYRMACRYATSKAFGPMEIQSFEIDSAGPEVSHLANDLLFNCFGPRFSVKLITQEEKADGKGYKDEFDVSVYDEQNGKTGSISSLSGGEQTIVSEAVSLAIALYNKEKNGIVWDTLFRDEVSGALDDVYAPKYITMLRTAQTMGHFKRVYFICHQDRLKEMADSRIVVSKGKISIEA